MPVLKDFTSNFSEKDKRNVRLALTAVVLVAVVIGLVTISGDDTKKSKKEPPPKKGKFSVLTDKVEKESWIAAQGANIKKLQQENEEFKKNITELQGEIQKLQGRQKDVEAQAKQSLANSQVQKGQQKDGLPPLPKVDSGQNINANSSNPRAQRGPGMGKVQETIKIYTDTSGEKEKGVKEKGQRTKSDIKNKSLVLSSGSFMKGILLNGIDAPTDFASKGEPYPVLINVADITKLPNLVKMNLRDCFIIGAGYGNLADERAYIRTEKLSCITDSGGVIDTKLKGHIIGEDGKLGVRGTLISKQGQMIAQSLLAGTLGGLSKAFKPQQSVAINLNPNGEKGYVSPDMGDVFKSGGAEGVSTAMNKVADFYLKMAEKIFPIIEISAGRHIDVLVLEQATLEQNGTVDNGNIGG